ncbi:hypothetical protein PMAYCL1PPCAC_05114, partial [Pristionchus mayeri]
PMESRTATPIEATIRVGILGVGARFMMHVCHFPVYHSFSIQNPLHLPPPAALRVDHHRHRHLRQSLRRRVTIIMMRRISITKSTIKCTISTVITTTSIIMITRKIQMIVTITIRIASAPITESARTPRARADRSSRMCRSSPEVFQLRMRSADRTR